MESTGKMPTWMTAKLTELSEKMCCCFDCGDVERALWLHHIWNCIYCGWYYRRGPCRK